MQKMWRNEMGSKIKFTTFEGNSLMCDSAVPKVLVDPAPDQRGNSSSGQLDSPPVSSLRSAGIGEEGEIDA